MTTPAGRAGRTLAGVDQTELRAGTGPRVIRITTRPGPRGPRPARRRDRRLQRWWVAYWRAVARPGSGLFVPWQAIVARLVLAAITVGALAVLDLFR